MRSRPGGSNWPIAPNEHLDIRSHDGGTPVLKAEYSTRGPVPEAVIAPVELHLEPPRPHEVRVAVVASPINPSDVLTLTGEYGMLPDLPAVGGNEGVGRVIELGDGVQTLGVDDLVLLPVGVGTWRTQLNAKAERLFVLPKEADPLQLSMMAVNPPTASLLLSEFVDLAPGDWVIQNAANSGVGGYLIQLAASRGIHTINVVRREGAVESVKAIGAENVIVDGPGLRRRVVEITGGDRVRLAIDAVGGDATGRLASTLGDSGTVVAYGSMSGEPSTLSAASLIFHGVTLTGFWLARWFQHADLAEQARVFSEIASMIASGSLRAEIAATYGVEDIRDAVRHAARGERDGKVLIVPHAEDHS